MQYNIDRERKSKLSYYIEIELELFPGTQINTIQKYSVKCQTTFERIREAWADIFGFEYRPGVLDEAYEYQAQNKDIRREPIEGRREERREEKRGDTNEGRRDLNEKRDERREERREERRGGNKKTLKKHSLKKRNRTLKR